MYFHLDTTGRIEGSLAIEVLGLAVPPGPKQVRQPFIGRAEKEEPLARDELLSKTDVTILPSSAP